MSPSIAGAVAVLTDVAAAVGAGILLGGFLVGLVGTVRAWPRRRLDRGVVHGGYVGGSAGLIALVVDALAEVA